MKIISVTIKFVCHFQNFGGECRILTIVESVASGDSGNVIFHQEDDNHAKSTMVG